jgi:hypothetical protein
MTIIFIQRVGWVERSDTHQMVFMPRWVSQRAQPILRATLIRSYAVGRICEA